MRPGAIDQIRTYYKSIKKLMAEYGDGGKKIWFTEIGCPGVKRPTKDNGWWEGASPTEVQQAAFVKDVFTRAIELPDVEKVFWAYFRDNDKHFNSGVDYFGLVRWDFSRKPAFEAYKRAIRRWVRP